MDPDEMEPLVPEQHLLRERHRDPLRVPLRVISYISKECGRGPLHSPRDFAPSKSYSGGSSHRRLGELIFEDNQ